jgi:hypothetical protein
MIVRLELPIARQHEAKLKAEEEQKIPRLSSAVLIAAFWASASVD